jgi:hypothetical protein
VLVGYQDNGSSNNGVSYVLDLSTETLKSIAGVAKEAGVESNVIDVVTQGECDFLSGLVAGSYYYSSATGFLSASVGDYEVGVAKSATNLLLNAVIPTVDEEKIAFIDRLVANSMTPSIEQALLYDFWKTREVKTSSGTFTVPSNVYAVGIFCLGAGANGSTTQGGGGGGLSMKIKKVNPGDIVQYTISAGVASCDGMTANPASGITGGTASGGMYSYSGGTTASGVVCGGAGCGGNSFSTYHSGGGSMRHWAQSSAPAVSRCTGGLGMFHTDAVEKSRINNINELYGGGGFGSPGLGSQNDLSMANIGGVGRPPSQLGIFVTTDITGNNGIGLIMTGQSVSSGYMKAGDWNGGGYIKNVGALRPDGGIGGGGGFNYANVTNQYSGNGGLGGGGGCGTNTIGNNAYGGNGGLGGGGGATDTGSSYGGQGGYGGGGGAGATPGTGGSSVVIFVF